ncbi:unnamed protein product [Auanema sp. JU1783]|nr:unnamed protein product [Auanema sp. JU1783]
MAEPAMEPRTLVFRWITIHSHIFYSLMTCYLIVLIECTFHSYKMLQVTSVGLPEKAGNNTTSEKVFDLGIIIGSSVMHGLSLICILVCSCLLEVRTFYQATPPMLITIISTFNVVLNVFGSVLLMIKSDVHRLFSAKAGSFAYMVRGAFYISIFSLMLSITSSLLNIFFPSRHSVKYSENNKDDGKTTLTMGTKGEISEAAVITQEKAQVPKETAKPAGDLGAFMTY